eukprot:27848-Prymnesium_polylepis.2
MAVRPSTTNGLLDGSSTSPHGKRAVALPACAAYCHSMPVGSLPPAQAQNSCASAREMAVTGVLAFPSAKRPASQSGQLRRKPRGSAGR